MLCTAWTGVSDITFRGLIDVDSHAMPIGVYHGAMSGRRPVLVANGPFSWTAELAALAAAADPLLAADGGANQLALLGLLPTTVVGDMDSILPSTRAWIGEKRLQVAADQERTDLEKALHHALRVLGLDCLTVLGALGGRVDHATVNLGLLATLSLGSRLEYREPGSVVVAIRGTAELESTPDELWSFWSFDPQVRVSLSGVRWPVDRLPLHPCGRISVSNRALAQSVRVCAEPGPVLAMRHLSS